MRFSFTMHYSLLILYIIHSLILSNRFCQGHGQSRVCPGITGHEAGIHLHNYLHQYAFYKNKGSQRTKGTHADIRRTCKTQNMEKIYTWAIKKFYQLFLFLQITLMMSCTIETCGPMMQEISFSEHRGTGDSYVL